MRQDRRTILTDSDPDCPVNPERNLLAAVLAIAIQDLGSDNVFNRRDATQFFLKEDEDDNLPFSFRYICSELDIDADDILIAIQNTNIIKKIIAQRVARPVKVLRVK